MITLCFTRCRESARTKLHRVNLSSLLILIGSYSVFWSFQNILLKSFFLKSGNALLYEEFDVWMNERVNVIENCTWNLDVTYFQIIWAIFFISYPKYFLFGFQFLRSWDQGCLETKWPYREDIFFSNSKFALKSELSRALDKKLLISLLLRDKP